MDDMKEGMSEEQEMPEGAEAQASPAKKIGDMVFNLREAMLGLESALSQDGKFPPQGIKALQGAIQNYTQFMGVAGQVMGIPQMAEAAQAGPQAAEEAAPQGPMGADMPMPRKGVKAVPAR